MTILSIVLLISGIFIFNFITEQFVEDLNSPITSTITKTEIEYKIFECENTKILSEDEKKQVYNSFLWSENKYLEEEWKVCNTSCSDTCENYCSNNQNDLKIITLRGDTPSCICGC